MPSRLPLVVVAVVLCMPVPTGASAQTSFGGVEIFGEVGIESKLFVQEPLVPDQPRWHNLSMSGRLEVEERVGDGVTFRSVAFGRWDESDPLRTHADLREAFLRIGQGSLVGEVGMNVVFWGVTESRHLVDVVNQTDYLEDLDGDEKLGQLMARLSYDHLSYGLFEAFVMGGSRPQRFPGLEGRPGLPVPVLYDEAVYASGAARWDPDLALRWSHAAGRWDWGLSFFRGTNRDAALLPVLRDRQPALRPTYDLVRQFGLALQWTGDSWLWKLEGIHRDGPEDPFFATTFGFERTFWGALGASTDVGILVEYSYDGRDDRTFTVHDDDLFGGVRIVLNDVSGTEVLAGVLTDLDTGAVFASVEASRRMGDRWALDLTGRSFAAGGTGDPLSWFRRDDHLEVALAYFF